MRRIDVDGGAPGAWRATLKGVRYIPLGTTGADQLSASAARRIDTKEQQEHDPQVWGTLGSWQPGTLDAWHGSIRFSASGNDFSSPEESGLETQNLIEEVARHTADPGTRVRERFVALGKLRFGDAKTRFLLSEHPSIRLTLFLKGDEGALVFLQRGEGTAAAAEFITPERTDSTFTCHERDRLTYRIPVDFAGGVKDATAVEGEEGDVDVRCAEHSDGFASDVVLKVLTFKRKNSTSHDVVRRVLARLGRDRTQLLRFNPAIPGFEPAGPGDVDTADKTLLMLHGTFSSTNGSFGPLTEGGGFSWLSKLAFQPGPYQQILAFDHDTVFESLGQNAAHLTEAVGGQFAQPLDLMTHSRGGLLGKHLAAVDDAYRVRRAAMTACANGVGYMRTARNISRFLSVVRHLFMSAGPASIAVALAQHSVHFVATLPGLDIMNPRNAELNALLNADIPPAQRPVILPIVGDYDRRLVRQDGFFKRLALNGLDLIIKAMLGRQHDWVVGTEEQARIGPGIRAPQAVSAPVTSWHTTYYKKSVVREQIRPFLEAPDL